MQCRCLARTKTRRTRASTISWKHSGKSKKNKTERYRLSSVYFLSQTLNIEMADCFCCTVNVCPRNLEILRVWYLFTRSYDRDEKENGSEWINGSRNTNEFVPLRHQPAKPASPSTLVRWTGRNSSVLTPSPCGWGTGEAATMNL